jgi:hypothetical protein
MTGLDKLKTRTEWQAYLVTIIIVFLDQFLDIGIDAEHLMAIVSSTGFYGVSRGLAKYEGKGKEVEAAAQEGAAQDS